MKRIIFLLMLFNILSTFIMANMRKDSLLKVWENQSLHDTIRLDALDDFIWEFYVNSDPDSAIVYLNMELNFAKKNNLLEWQSIAHNTMGTCYYFLGDIEKAIMKYKEGLKIDYELNDKKGISASLANVGAILKEQGNNTEAMRYYMKSLKVCEELDDKAGMSKIYNNMAMLYNSQNETVKAIEFYERSLKLKKEIKDEKGYTNTLVNIGLFYFERNELEKALKYYEEALASEGAKGNAKILGTVHHNIGGVYAVYGTNFRKQGKLDEAVKYELMAVKNLNDGYEIRKQVGDIHGMSTSLNNLALIYLEQKNINEAFRCSKESYQYAEESGILEDIFNSSKTLYKCLKLKGDLKGALEMHEIYVMSKDSLTNEKSKKDIIRQEFEYDYKKKSAEDSVAREKEKEIEEARFAQQSSELRAKKLQQYFLFGGLALVLVFAIFIYNRFRLISKQKIIIEKKNIEVHIQKKIIEEKHKEITDSINYAERIQRSFLASKDQVKSVFPEHFIYFNPKESVSGDFYWCERLKNGDFCMVVADSTGHGVPGAIMSILNITCLENAVKDGLTVPSEILNHTRKNIIERLKKDGSVEGGKDGMDCALICFDFEKKKLKFALANNPLWIIRNGEFIEFKPDKMPVGKHDRQEILFTSHEIEIFNGDLIYIFTDGYADQFGGKSGKKFKYSNLQKLLMESSMEGIEMQYPKIKSAFEEWKGDLEQVDDVCVIGVKI